MLCRYETGKVRLADCDLVPIKEVLLRAVKAREIAHKKEVAELARVCARVSSGTLVAVSA
jgi:hypothetical protein